MTEQNADLLKKIAELEAELKQRENDLGAFQQELLKANQQIEAVIGQMTQELKLAHLIQKLVVPTQLPSIPGIDFSTKFLPSNIAGSDYYDIFEHENKLKFSIILASSSGYGLSALFLSVLLKLSGQLEARRGSTPKDSVQKIIAELVPHIKNHERAHLFYGVIDRSRFELQYTKLGSILALHQAKGKWQQLALGGPALQMGFQQEVVQGSVSLEPHDRLVLCSDGVKKVANAKGEVFGEERIVQTVFAGPSTGVHELRNEIFFKLKDFAGHQEFPQDVTILVIEVQDKVIKLAQV